jgi:hypothetical protein
VLYATNVEDEAYKEFTLTLNPQELAVVRSALRAMLKDFGHDEVAQVRALKALLARLPEI